MTKGSGIYKIVNTVTSKYYIGSSVSLYWRRHKHLQMFRSGTHFNRHLQSAWKKYGEESFCFEVVEECCKDILIEKEQYWIDKLSPHYNIKLIANSSVGVKRSPETIAKLKARPKRVAWNKGLKMGKQSEELIAKRVLNRAPYRHSEEVKQRIRATSLATRRRKKD